MTKPIVNIKDCYVYPTYYGTEVLSGIPSDYPEDHCYRPNAVTNNKRVWTTDIVKRSGNIVETKRTIYQVANWLTKEHYDESQYGRTS